MSVGRLLRFTSTNVFSNLAAEERLFQKSVDRSLLFYTNSECVVIGRTQNPFKEVDVSFAEQNRIPIARRRSGGGTVVHDEGNLNFCFMRPRSEHEPLKNAKLVADVLKDEFGIHATVNSRADILVEGLKVSGAAYRISRDRAYHHGTLLINSDLDRLRRLLKSPLADNLDALGAASVRSPVTNLAEHCPIGIDAESVVEALAHRFARKRAGVTLLSADNVERTFGGTQSERAELESHAWVYGKMPRFSYRLHFDNSPFDIQVGKGGIISQVSVGNAGATEPASVDERLAAFLTETLSGKRFDGRILADTLKSSAQKSGGRNLGSDISRLELLASELELTIPAQYFDSAPRSQSEADSYNSGND